MTGRNRALVAGATAMAGALLVGACQGVGGGAPAPGSSSPSPVADGAPPSPPTGVRVTGHTPTTVSLAWEASTDNVGVVAYDVYHDGQLTNSVNGTTLAATATDLRPGAAYGWYVNARDAAGNVSQASTTVTDTTPPAQEDSVPPSTPAALRTTAVSGTCVSLAWDASTDNVGVSGYDVYIAGTEAVGSSTTTNAQVCGRTPATTYVFTVRALDAVDNVSEPSNALTVTTSGSCTQPVCTVTQRGTSTDVPWGLVTLPDGSILFNERDSHRVVRISPDGTKAVVGQVPGVEGTDGEGGLLGLEISPTFASDHWLYFYYTTSSDNRITRIKYENDALVAGSQQVLVDGIGRNKYHNGGRLRFGPDGRLYAGTGDAQNGNSAQNLENLDGKVLRINPDGSIPSDNPFPGSAIFSYGHRNIQGLDFDSQGRLWEAEFGNSVMDEMNIIQKGGNYGWPSCEGTSGSGCGNDAFVAPVRTFPVADASCSGLTIVNNVIYLACLRSTRLYRMAIDGGGTGSPTAFFLGTYGRLRTVEAAPDGGLWLTSSSGDKDSIANNSSTQILHVALGG